MPQRARKKMQNNVEITIKTEQAEKTFEGKCWIQENTRFSKKSISRKERKMSKVKINIVDQDGNKHDLEKDLLFGCAMDSAGEGNCQCMSFYVGEGVKNITASGAIADGIVKTFHEVAKEDQNEEVQMLCNTSNVINMRIHEILGGKDNGGN